MSNLHRGHSIDASYQASVHLAKRLVGSIYGRSSLKSAHFVMIHYQTWPPQAILVSDWLISKKSSPLKPLCQMNRNLVGSILGKSSIYIAHGRNEHSSVNGRFRVETIELRRAHVHSSLLVATSNHSASNKKKIV
jgi:hypothetical protein